MKTRKICLLGDFAVGKTSLVRRFVRQQFAEKYHTTVGVKVDTKVVELPRGESVKLVVWDIAGTRIATAVFKAYLKGAAGFLLVADGTRAHTLDGALSLLSQVDGGDGARPYVGLLNKADLANAWEIPAERVAALRDAGHSWLETSAKSGAHVDEAFHRLAELIETDNG